MEAAMTNYIYSDEHAVISYDRTEARQAFDHERLAYVIEETVEGMPGFSIYSGSGQHLGHLDTRDIAFATAIQYDMQALSVH
jgi:hypothetical protein